MLSRQQPLSTPRPKQLQQLLAEESTQVPAVKLGILLLLFAGNLVAYLRSYQLCVCSWHAAHDCLHNQKASGSARMSECTVFNNTLLVLVVECRC